jgi:hypothetical protein
MATLGLLVTGAAACPSSCSLSLLARGERPLGEREERARSVDERAAGRLEVQGLKLSDAGLSVRVGTGAQLSTRLISWS